MTNEKALQLLEVIKYCDVDERAKIEVIDMAIAAIRAQNGRGDPKRLTIKELRKMDGQPVRVVCDEEATKTTPGFEPLIFCALVEVCDESIFLTNNLGGRTEYAADVELEDDGITVYCYEEEM